MVRLVMPLLLGLLWSGTAEATTLSAGGLEFSDEEGGIILREAFGTGTLEDPITVVEDITDDGPAVLVIRGMRASFGNKIGTDHSVGFALHKIVRNMTSRPWHSFELEVREIKARESNYQDGLSFGQAMGSDRRFASDRFTEMTQQDEPIDSVVFSGATIQPGESVAVRVLVTDFSPNWQFYVVQRRDAPLALRQP